MTGIQLPLLHAPLGLPHVLILAALLFSMGLYGVLALRHAVRILMSLELMLNAVNLMLVALANFLPSATPLRGQVFALFVIAVAAAEASVALAIFLLLYKQHQTVDMDKVDSLKW
ncbi:MAG: NADH-quinone oxidoreductase subunit NuoK [Cyanobacteria bacterium REEB65]|nr:NADH-quinone oxidoreductase subunit NuoK [Cyanobacteria bacterium REEB65]